MSITKYSFKKLIYFSVLLTSALTCINTRADQRDKYIGVDLRDVAKYASRDFAEARVVLKNVKVDPESFFGPQYRDVKTVYGIELYDAVTVTDDVIKLPVVLLAETTQGHFYFRKVIVAMTDGKVIDIRMTAKDLDLHNAHFNARVGIYERKTILEDTENHIKIIYPIGLGGVNELSPSGEIKFSTPQITNAFIEKRNVIAKRTEPAYYKGMPFIDISKPRGHQTDIAFHIEVNDEFRRSFESHGCIRLREKDLMEFFNIVMQTTTPLRLEIKLQLPDGGDHPYPLHDSDYERVKNFGTRKKPRSKRSETDHLIIMERVNATPPWLKKADHASL